MNAFANLCQGDTITPGSDQVGMNAEIEKDSLTHVTRLLSIHILTPGLILMAVRMGMRSVMMVSTDSDM